MWIQKNSNAFIGANSDAIGSGIDTARIVVVGVIAFSVVLLVFFRYRWTKHGSLTGGTAPLPFGKPREETLGVKGVATSRKQAYLFSLLEIVDANRTRGAHSCREDLFGRLYARQLYGGKTIASSIGQCLAVIIICVIIVGRTVHTVVSSC